MSKYTTSHRTQNRGGKFTTPPSLPRREDRAQKNERIESRGWYFYNRHFGVKIGDVSLQHGPFLGSKNVSACRVVAILARAYAYLEIFYISMCVCTFFFFRIAGKCEKPNHATGTYKTGLDITGEKPEKLGCKCLYRFFSDLRATGTYKIGV